MQVICLEERAFFQLLEKVVAHLKEKHNVKEDRWITAVEAQRRLGVSKSTMQRLRDSQTIVFSQPRKKIILYDSHSINDYLNKHSHKTI